MFQAMGFTDVDELEKSNKIAEQYFERTIPRNQFIGWVATVNDEKIISTGGLVFDEHPPGPNNTTGKIAYIMNLSTDIKYRRKGVARAILRTILSYVNQKGIKVVSLHATDMGKRLYQELGFQDSNEMRLKL
jgi:ribosomal protein S18 acetylase RimI-like enzyme